jgi:hypothetical protein
MTFGAIVTSIGTSLRVSRSAQQILTARGLEVSTELLILAVLRESGNPRGLGRGIINALARRSREPPSMKLR